MEVVKLLRGFVGAVKSKQGVFLSLLLILSLSWFADGLSGLVELGETEGWLKFWMLLIFLLISMGILFLIYKKLTDLWKSRKRSITYISSRMLLVSSVSFLLLLLVKYHFLKWVSWLTWSQIILSSITFTLSLVMVREFLNIEVFAGEVSKEKWSKFKAVVVFLSAIKDEEKEEINEILKETALDVQKFIQKCEEVKENKKIKWEMIAKLISEMENLEYLYIITSKTVGKIKGSYEDRELFEKLFSKIFKGKILFHERPINFGNFEESLKSLMIAYENLKKEGLSENQIIIDTTGGQKIQSLAGGFMASGYDRYFAYVDTNTMELKIYDVQISF